jgi:RNA polymerase sigma factor (sigma-70 family)
MKAMNGIPYSPRLVASEASAMAGYDNVVTPMLRGGSEEEKSRRFREATLPHLDALYTAARYFTRNATDADDAVQECYLRAFRHFDGFRGTEIKPWLVAILRNVCRAEYARRSNMVATDFDTDELQHGFPIWQEEQDSPEDTLRRGQDAASIRALVAALPPQFREVVVLRDIDDLSYREIAQAVDVPIGTVMSRLARGRSMLRAAWTRLEDDGKAQEQISDEERPI